MKSIYRKKLDKIYNNLDKLALKGKENFVEYYSYIDELVEKGDYDSFQQCLYVYYKIDINNISDLQTVKKSTWDKICFQTDSSFLKRLKKLYDVKNVYQTSFDIYSSDNSYVNINLSQPLSITYSSTGYTQSLSVILDDDIAYISVKFSNYKLEFSKSNYLGKIIEREVYTPDTKYFIQNKQYASITGSRKTYLEVYKVDSFNPTGFATASIYAYDNFDLPEDQNLITRYSNAIDYLNS
jgi:hypothetical protein